jgi:hypothetical protein
MISRSFKSSTFAASLACGLALTFALPVAAPATFGITTAAHAQQPSAQPAQFQSILANYGTFQNHDRYGEIWIPSQTTVPEGWHPYPPCNWVHDKQLGWYFNDKTEWGKIVHHYGRWAHDATLGWVWVKGEEFSPGWVVWRTSDKWVGWAPLPPDQDVREISTADFNTDKHWTFVDAKKFSSTCTGGNMLVSAPPALYPTIVTETEVVTELRWVRGIAIFVLPPPLIITVVDLNIGVFSPWSPCFFGAWFWNWNSMTTNVIININVGPGGTCPSAAPSARPNMPIQSNPPPAPGGRGTRS